MKRIIKLSILLLITSLFIPLIISNADYDPNEFLDDSVVSEASANGITLVSEVCKEEDKEAILNIYIDSEILDNDGITGISAELGFIQVEPESVTVFNPNWEVTATKFEKNGVRFLVEKERNSENEVLGVPLKIEIKGKAEDPFFVIEYGWLNNKSFKMTDNYNNVQTPLSDIRNLAVKFNQEFLPFDKTIYVKEEYGYKTVIDDEKIYAKVNEYADTKMANLIDVLKTIHLSNLVERIAVYSGESAYNIPANQELDGLYDMFANIPIQNIDRIEFLREHYEYPRFTICEMGNVYYEEGISESIDINDVMMLRQAVVGEEETLDDPNFHIEAADVNFSNRTREEIGDIADIIEIRARILYGNWDGLENKIGNYEVIGKIEIPKTNCNYSILNSTSPEALSTSVGYVRYGNGLNEPGNSLIFGHNYRNDMFFSRNQELETKDIMYITDRQGRKIKYIIVDEYITDPSDPSMFTKETYGMRMVTLQTCTDDGTERFIIHAVELYDIPEGYRFEGEYAIDSSDVSIEFFLNGKVRYGVNEGYYEGNYVVTEDNGINVHLTSYRLSNTDTGGEREGACDITESYSYINDKLLYSSDNYPYIKF